MAPADPQDRPADLQRARLSELDVEEWADYWASLKVDAVLVSVTGILAFYPTQVPYHRRSQFLGDRDLFGACTAAAKKRGLRVIARMSPDLNWEDAVKAYPGVVHAGRGCLLMHGEDPRLFRTCTFSTYFTEHAGDHARGRSADADGLNAWPQLDQLPVCYCDVCRKLAKPKTVDYWQQFTDFRISEIWKPLRRHREEKKPGQPLLRQHGQRHQCHAQPDATGPVLSGTTATTM